MHRYDLVLLNRLATLYPSYATKKKNELLCAEFIVKIKYIGMKLFAMNELPPYGE